MKRADQDKERRIRIRYQTVEWPAACQGQGWRQADEAKRRDERAKCWEAIGLKYRGDAMIYGDAEVTALFTYLRHLADPDHIGKSIEWDKCCRDYIAYNTAKQADHWERRGFGRHGSRKLQENRFGGRRTAKGGTFDDPLTQEEADQRLWKMRQRTREREGRAGSPQPADESAPIDPELIPF